MQIYSISIKKQNINITLLTKTSNKLRYYQAFTPIDSKKDSILLSLISIRFLTFLIPERTVHSDL